MTIASRGAQAVIEVRGLTKSYGGDMAVGGIDLSISRGEVFALLGPNGAGETTTVEILEGYRRRDGGEVSVLGSDPGRQWSQLKKRIGIVLQSTGVDRYLTVAETVTMYAGYYPHPRDVAEVLELVGLADKRNARVLTLSGGQQRRLDVAVALAGDPDPLFLDEPTTGFDPNARHDAWDNAVHRYPRGWRRDLLLTRVCDHLRHSQLRCSPPIVNATILPLLFLSGVFIPLGDDAPTWIAWTARIFHVKYFAGGM
jgi:ABC-type branched-subunit amino acid transport system ATPase component